MSSSQFVLAYACDRPDAMSDQELIIRLNAATEHLESIAPGVSRIHMGGARIGFAVWEFEDPGCRWPAAARRPDEAAAWLHVPAVDRKSTRLNSSHVAISYAVFCVKKKIRLRKWG